MCRTIEEMCRRVYQESRAEITLEITKRMLAENMSLERIAHIVGPSVDEVLRLRAENA